MSDFRQTRFSHSTNRAAIMVHWLIPALLCVFFASLPAAAQDKDKPIEDKLIQSPADGWPLKLTYYKSTEGKEASVVVLMHMKGENRLMWTAPKGFAEQLQGKGFAVVAVDLRKHGQSKPGAENEDPKKASTDKSKKSSAGLDLKPADYQLMVRDMDAIKKFIFDEHQNGNLNMRKTAIVAPGMSAAIGVTFAAADWQKVPYNDAPTLATRTPRGQDVQAMVFLSPDTTLPGVPAHLVTPQFRSAGIPMASLILVGKTDPQDKDQAKQLFIQLGGDPAKTTPKKPEPKKAGQEKEPEKENKERLFYIEVNAKLRGTELLGKRLGIEDAITSFLHDHVQMLKGPEYEWRNRQSRLLE